MTMNLLELKQNLENHFQYSFNINKDLNQGLINTSHAFIEAKLTNSKPTDLAITIAQGINEYLISNKFEYKASIAGPYVNIELSINEYHSLLSNRTIPQDNSQVLLEYLSPNVAKELHLGHMRNMNIGDSIRRLLQIKYPNLKTDNHWGDWGVQFGKLIWAYKQFQTGISSTCIINDAELPISFDIYNQDKLQGLIRMYVWAEQNKDNYSEYDSLVRQEFVLLESGDPNNIKLWQEFVLTSKEEVAVDMTLFKVPKFDLEQGESYYEKYNDSVYNYFESNNLWLSDGKARYIDFEKLSEVTNNPSIKNLGFGYMVSSTGYTTYLFRDVCARIDWVSVLGSTKMITVTGNEQLHHFKQLIAICEYLSTLNTPFKGSNNLTAPNIQHIPYGFLTLKGGQKMSTRKGIIHNARKMYNDVLAVSTDNLANRNSIDIAKKAPIIALAGIKWTDLSKDTTHDIEFDLNDLLSFEGNTGMYQLYTLARINSVIQKNRTSGQVDYSLLNEAELSIAKKIILFPLQLNEAINKLKPHYIVNYCYELTNMINSWYNTTSLLKEENQNRKATLIELLSEVQSTLIFALDKLGIEALEEI
jgi:arginyl-tRNA synthetase